MFNKTMKKVLIAGVLVLSLALVIGASVPKTAQAEEPPQRLMSVTGEAEVAVRPDMATVTFGVETNASTARQAQLENSRLMNQVITTLMANDIAKEDIQTSNFSLYPVYETQGEKPVLKQVVAGYRCNNTVVVRIRDITKVGMVIDAAVGAGATNVGGISFGLDDPKEYKDRALTQAVQNAREKAEIMAKAAGVQISGIAKMSDGWVSVVREMVKFNRELAYGAGVPVEPGELVVRASVRIDFTF